MREMIATGEKTTIENYRGALEFQVSLIRKMDDFFTNYDVLLCLSTAGAAPYRGIIENPDPALMWTLTHLPAINAPVFSSPENKPFGLQIVARKYNDHLLLSFLDFLRERCLVPQHPNPMWVDPNSG